MSVPSRIPSMRLGRRTAGTLALLALGAPALALAQAPPAATPAPALRIEAIPDPAKIPLAEVAYVHPLWHPLDAPPKILDRPNPHDLTARATLFTTLRLDETGKVIEGQAVQPPLAALSETTNALIPKWRFQAAKRGGGVVATWATYGIELEIALEKGVYSAFSLLPVAKDEPLAAIVKESVGDSWITRYPREIVPKDPAAVSIEDVDVLPVPEKTRWSFSTVRTHARITALVEVSSVGAVRRIVPTGTYEPLLLSWVRQNAATWKLTPAAAPGGKPVDSWMVLDATLDYTIDDAREKGKRSVKKNLRGAPPA